MFRITLARAATAVALSFTGAVTAGTLIPAHAAGSDAYLAAAPAAARGLTAAHTPAARHLPAWFDWTYATWATTREVCGKHAKRRAVVVWAKNDYNDNSVVMCANGKISAGS